VPVDAHATGILPEADTHRNLTERKASTVTETGKKDKKETRHIWSTRRGRWGVAATVTILPLLAFGITTNSAQAQPGSRVCGAYWEGTSSDGDKIRHIQAAEVPKTDHAVCADVMDSFDNFDGRDDFEVGGSRAINMMTCEAFGRFANNTKGANPCLNMERRDNVFDEADGLTFTVTL
jgi:hypothetical protein